MKVFGYLLCCILLIACKGGKKNNEHDTANTDTIAAIDSNIDRNGFKPYKLNKYYTVTDTGEYSTVLTGGHYAIVERDGKIADTIDMGYGIREIAPDHYLYSTLKKTTDSIGNTVSAHYLDVDEGDYLTVFHNQKVPLVKLAEKFDNYFSSPSVLNGKIYYWQLRSKDEDSPVDLYAAVYDALTYKTQSQYLLTHNMGTDYSGYLPNPYMEGGAIIFTLNGIKKYSFSPDFKLLK